MSTTQVELQPTRLVVTAGFAPGDLRLLLPAAIRASAASWKREDQASFEPVLREVGAHLLELHTETGLIAWSKVEVSLAVRDSIMFRLTAPRPAAARLSLRLLTFDRLPPGHRDYFTVTGERGENLLEKLVDASAAAAAIPLPDVTEPPPVPTFWAFLRLGIAHIWTGYDHLLFLFGLLIVCRSFRSIVTIISCFTLAHSLTLALATLNIVNLPSHLVEPMIAASIVFVGLENLFRRGAEPVGRWAITFAFGLIHGFGFASVLRELGVGSNGHGLALPLFTFNLGVEIGQVTIAALVLPIVWQLRKNPGFVRRGVPILSGIVAAAGLYWFLERTLF